MGNLSSGMLQASDENSSLVGVDVPLESRSVGTFGRLDSSTKDGGVESFVLNSGVTLLRAVRATTSIILEGSESDALVALKVAMFDTASLSIGILKLSNVIELTKGI